MSVQVSTKFERYSTAVVQMWLARLVNSYRSIVTISSHSKLACAKQDLMKTGPTSLIICRSTIHRFFFAQRESCSSMAPVNYAKRYGRSYVQFSSTTPCRQLHSAAHPTRWSMLHYDVAEDTYEAFKLCAVRTH